MTSLKVKPGVSTTSVRNIPEKWSRTWFHLFIPRHLQNMDIRNSVAGPGIVISDAVTGLVPPTEQNPAMISLAGATPGASPFSGTVTTAKLTSGGAEGSQTFLNGLCVSQVQAT